MESFPPTHRPYRELLLTNGPMLLIFGGLFGLGRRENSLVLMLLAIFFAIGCFLVELLLFAYALARRRVGLAVCYGVLCAAVAMLDLWLLEQSE